ncbi:MAG: hypothetical protein OXP74_08050 [Acidobacteriota bacterium]|nr:hypothetical protein [Acidobacteriota bacterium]
MDGSLYWEVLLFSIALIALLVFLVRAAVKARTRGGRAVSLIAALLVVLVVLVGPPVFRGLAGLVGTTIEALSE